MSQEIRDIAGSLQESPRLASTTSGIPLCCLSAVWAPCPGSTVTCSAECQLRMQHKAAGVTTDLGLSTHCSPAQILQTIRPAECERMEQLRPALETACSGRPVPG